MWNIFRTCGRDDQQGAVAGNYLAKNFKGKKVAVVHDKTPYGKGLADETQKAMNSKGLKEVMYEGVNTGEKDYSALVSKLKQANVDVVYFGGLHTEAGLIIRQMRDQGLNAPMMSRRRHRLDGVRSIAGPGAEGTLMTFSPDPRKNPNAKAVGREVPQEELRARGLHALQLRGGRRSCKQAAEAVKSTDPKKMAEYMQLGQDLQDRDRRHLLRQEGRHHPSGLRHVRLEEGRRRQDRLLGQRDGHVSSRPHLDREGRPSGRPFRWAPTSPLPFGRGRVGEADRVRGRPQGRSGNDALLGRPGLTLPLPFGEGFAPPLRGARPSRPARKRLESQRTLGRIQPLKKPMPVRTRSAPIAFST